MELSAELNRDKNIFIVHVVGQYRRPHDGYELFRFVINAFVEHGYRRILLDLTEAEIQGGASGAYETANPNPEMDMELKKLHLAVVYSEITETDSFFGVVAFNRGYNIRVFDNRDSAIAWLEIYRSAPVQDDL